MYKIINTPFKIDLPQLLVEVDILLKNEQVQMCMKNYQQIGLTYANEKCNNKFYDAVGSLDLDYDARSIEDEKAGIPPHPKKTKYSEHDFNKIVPDIKGLYIYELLTVLKEHYDVGRTRLMFMESKKCLTWHTDSTPRMHIPIVTHESCKMVWENQTLHMPAGNLFWVDTRKPHTAFNGSYSQRIHLVTTVK